MVWVVKLRWHLKMKSPVDSWMWTMAQRPSMEPSRKPWASANRLMDLDWYLSGDTISLRMVPCPTSSTATEEVTPRWVALVGPRATTHVVFLMSMQYARSGNPIEAVILKDGGVVLTQYRSFWSHEADTSVFFGAQ